MRRGGSRAVQGRLSGGMAKAVLHRVYYFIVFQIPYKYCTTDGVLPDYGMPTVLEVA